jgi:hypothetical protein
MPARLALALVWPVHRARGSASRSAATAHSSQSQQQSVNHRLSTSIASPVLHLLASISPGFFLICWESARVRLAPRVGLPNDGLAPFRLPLLVRKEAIPLFRISVNAPVQSKSPAILLRPLDFESAVHAPSTLLPHRACAAQVDEPAPLTATHLLCASHERTYAVSSIVRSPPQCLSLEIRPRHEKTLPSPIRSNWQGTT